MGVCINRAYLVGLLEKVKPGLATKELVEQSTSFIFLNSFLHTYNDEISVSCAIKDFDGVEGAVRAQEVYKLLTRMKDELVEIETTDSEFKVFGKKVKAGIALDSNIKIPLIDYRDKNKKWHDMPSDFLEALKFVSFSCSKDMARPVLTCVHVNKDYVEASDGYRISRRYLESNLGVHDFLIPATIIRHILNYEMRHICVDGEWVHFKTDTELLVSCRIFNEGYPDIDSIGVLAVEGDEIILPEILSDVVDRAEVLAKKDAMLGSEIIVSIEEKKLIVKGACEIGWFEEEVRLKYSGKPIKFLINPVFLKDILKLTLKSIIGDNKMKFVGDSWEYVMALGVGDFE